jgi:hypothetical protein
MQFGVNNRLIRGSQTRGQTATARSIGCVQWTCVRYVTTSTIGLMIAMALRLQPTPRDQFGNLGFSV